MRRKCFNCGEILPHNSLRCAKCGYMPDIEFRRKCPNLEVATCSLTGLFCTNKGEYQLCPIKNEADDAF